MYWLWVGTLALGAGLHLAGLTRIPPGLHSDEAFHMLRALDILHGVDFPRYITGNQGNEPLMAYLAAGVIAITGPVPWASRLVSAFASLIALAATVRIGREVAPGRWVALVAGLTWCTLSWALTVGRLGTQPMLSVMAAAVAMAGLLSGLRSLRWQDFALLGLGLGLGLDAYVAFRLFPAVALVTWAAAWLAASAERRRGLERGGLVAVIVAAVVYAPVASFFLQYPAWFFNRFNQVTDTTLGSPSLAGSLLDGTWRSIGGLFWSGDVNVRHNLPGRPGLDPAQIVLFIVGLIAVFRTRSWPAVALLLTWFLAAVAPGAVTDSAPHFLRMATITPALAVTIGLGADAIAGWSRRHAPWAWVGLALAWLASSIVSTWLVFTQWTASYEANYLFDQPSRWVAEQLRAAPIGTRLYLSPIPRENYTIEYILGPERYAELASYNGRECTILPEQTDARPPLIAVYTGEDRVTPQALAAAYPQMNTVAENVWTGTAQATVYQLPALTSAQHTIEYPLHYRFGDELEFLGWEAVDGLGAQAGDVFHLNTNWHLTATTTAAWVNYVHVRGQPKSDGNVVYAQRDSEPCDESFATWQWRPGERIVERTHVELPPDLPPGDYELFMGWYDRQTLTRLSVFDGNGLPIGDEIRLATITIR